MNRFSITPFRGLHLLLLLLTAAAVLLIFLLLRKKIGSTALPVSDRRVPF